MAGATSSGDDVEAGRINAAESTTVFAAQRPSELDQPFNGLWTLSAGPNWGDQHPDQTVNGVLGIGWNGERDATAQEGGAGVVGAGSPNRGIGVVGLGGGVVVSPPALGAQSEGDVKAVGVGGIGVSGIGGAGSPTPPPLDAGEYAAPSVPGAGVVGTGGVSLFPTNPPPPPAGSPPSAITGPVGNGPGVVGRAGGRGTTITPALAQAELRMAANVGVAGFGGPAKVAASVPGGFIGPESPGVGVLGIGGVNGSSPPDDVGGAGVVGVEGGSVRRPDSETARSGVVGLSDAHLGVRGITTSGTGVQGEAGKGVGVRGTATDGAGVVGTSQSNVGGRFESSKRAQVQLSPLRGLGTDPNGRIPGEAGDLLTMIGRDDGSGQQIASLWFCQIGDGNVETTQWVQLV
jgi:hypothetical protein